MAVRVSFDLASVYGRIRRDTEASQEILSNEALKDCNKYAKEDSGELIASSIRNSNLETGRLIWDTPYARRQYYLDSTSKDVNAEARKMWAHYAASKNKKKWLRMIKKITARRNRIG